MSCTALAPAWGVGITTGFGDGDIFVDVDEFGRSRTAEFDPVGPIGRGDVFFDSQVFLTLGDLIRGLGDLNSDAGTDPVILEETSNSLTSSFTVNQLGFELTQTVNPTNAPDGARTGAILTQSYTITNMTDVPNVFSLIRYLDGDLFLTDDTLADGGGLFSGGGGSFVLFQTDATGGPSDEDTFVGITASVGNNNTPGTPQEFTIENFSGGIPDFPLSNNVLGDTDGDNFIDSPFDVIVALQGDYRLQPSGQPGSTATFTTNTLFGNAMPPQPGSSEFLPLLPNADDEVDVGFGFRIPIVDFVEDPDLIFDPNFVSETIWLDPEIAVGYTYTVEGAEFAAITAPSLETVPDGEYEVVIGDETFSLLAGEELVFGSPISSFVLQGIDPELMLDPTDGNAFQLGFRFTNLEIAGSDAEGFSFFVQQVPITVETDPDTVIPLPAPILALGTGLVALAGLRRRRAAR